MTMKKNKFRRELRELYEKVYRQERKRRNITLVL